MCLGALYVVLILATLIAWSKTNRPPQVLSFSKYYMAQLSVIGFFMSISASWSIYALGYAWLVLVAVLHAGGASDTGGACHKRYVSATLGWTSFTYWATAIFFVQSQVDDIAPLLVLTGFASVIYVPFINRWFHSWWTVRL